MRSRHSLLLCALLLVAPLAACGGSGGGGPAAEVLDQASSNASGSSGWRADLDYSVAQTFVVGTAGALRAVEILTDSGGSTSTDPIVVEIRPTIGGVPDPDDADVLASASIPIGSLPSFTQFVRFDFPGGPDVQAGDVLALVVRGEGAAATFVWGGGDGTDYASGDVYLRNPSTLGSFSEWFSPVAPFGPADLSFRTYVAP